MKLTPKNFVQGVSEAKVEREERGVAVSGKNKGAPRPVTARKMKMPKARKMR